MGRSVGGAGVIEMEATVFIAVSPGLNPDPDGLLMHVTTHLPPLPPHFPSLLTVLLIVSNPPPKKNYKKKTDEYVTERKKPKNPKTLTVLHNNLLLLISDYLH